MRPELRTLIESYLTAANAELLVARSELQTDELLRAWKSGEIPAIGYLSTGRKFRFHGLGCRFTEGGDAVDLEIELTRNSEVAGFDAWRLFHFARQFESNENTFETLTSELQQLHCTGELTRSAHNSPYLYRLATDRTDV